MKRSTNHILTTHTGSLPRPTDLVDMVLRKEKKQPVDESVLAMRVRSAVAETVQRQAGAGVTVLNDGEQGKPGYSTYMKDRLTGFEGESTAAAISGEAKDFPEYTARRAGRAVPKRPACTGPIAWKDRDAVRRDIENLQAAVKGVEAEEGFMNLPKRVSCSVVSSGSSRPGRFGKIVNITSLISKILCPWLSVSGQTTGISLASRAFRKSCSA